MVSNTNSNSSHSISYTVTIRDGCILLKGPVPVHHLQHFAKVAPGVSLQNNARAVGDDKIAELADANYVIGLRQNLTRLKLSLGNEVVQKYQKFLDEGDLSKAAVNWLAYGEHVPSSKQIFSRITGISVGGLFETNIPLTTRDFISCRKMLEACPEIAAHLDEMREVSPVWDLLIENWGDLCRALDEDFPEWRIHNAGAAPRTAQALKFIAAQEPRMEWGSRPVLPMLQFSRSTDAERQT